MTSTSLINDFFYNELSSSNWVASDGMTEPPLFHICLYKRGILTLKCISLAVWSMVRKMLIKLGFGSLSKKFENQCYKVFKNVAYYKMNGIAWYWGGNGQNYAHVWLTKFLLKYTHRKYIGLQSYFSASAEWNWDFLRSHPDSEIDLGSQSELLIMEITSVPVIYSCK